MLIGSPSPDEFGFSLNPFHYVKKAASDVVHPIRTVKSAAHTALHVAEVPLKEVAHIAAGALKFALRPISSRVHTLTNRRAIKLSWDARKSRTPTPAERSQAKSWTKNHLKNEGPHGRILALFAGPLPPVPAYTAIGLLGQDPATVSLIAASIPVFMALMNKVLGKASASGEAPAVVGGKAVPDAPPADVADPGSAGGGADAGGGDAGGGGGGGGGGAKLFGMPRKYVIYGGIALGAVVVLSLMAPKKGST